MSAVTPLSSKNNLSVTLKYFLTFFLPFLLLLAVVDIYLFTQELKIRKDSRKKVSQELVSLMGKVINNKLSSTVSDLLVLASHNELQTLLDDGNESNINQLSNEFLEFAFHKNSYDQVRYINEKGSEIIRINVNDGAPEIASRDQLQSKNDRYYFTSTMLLQANEVYVSPFDLNVEGGKVEEPEKPMIRIATPVFDPQGNRRGIVIINYRGNKLLEEVEKIDGNMGGQSMLVNSDGFWLQGPDPANNWAFMYPDRKALNFGTLYPQAWKKISTESSGQFEQSNGIYTFETIYPLRESQQQYSPSSKNEPSNFITVNANNYQWKILSHISAKVLRAETIGSLHKFFSHSLISTVLLAIVAWLLATTIARGKKTETALALSQTSFHNIVERTNEGLLIVDWDNMVNYCNQAAADLLSCNSESLVDNPFPYPIETNKTVEFNVQAENQLVRDLEAVIIETEWKGKSAFLVTLRDITEKKKLRKSLEIMAAVIDQAAESVVITDRDGFIQYVNPAFSKSSGYSQTEAIGLNTRVLKSGQHNAIFYRKMWHTISEGKIWRGRFINKRKDGSLYEEEATISPVRDKNSYIVNYIASKIDLTNEVELMAQLRQAQKMEAIGTLAGGIAHDFNNILGAIMGYTELCIYSAKEDQEMSHKLEQILKASNRATDLVRQILTFSRQSRQERKPMGIQYEVKECLKLLRGSLPSTIEIKQSIDSSCRPVLADPTQIHQVIMNLATNAFHAMKDTEGVLKITLKEISINESRAPELADFEPGDYVQLSVSDNGHGIEPALMKRIFDPYFTTKEVGEGTGLGLATVHGIVRNHDGDIIVKSEVGQGTTFEVYLPVSLETDIEKLETEVADAPTSKGKEYILLVDDEEPLTDIIQTILENRGYEVDAFNASHDALAAFVESPNKYNLIITDQTMPKMIGTELVRRIRKLNSAVPVILCSGFTEGISETILSQLEINDFIKKPFSPFGFAHKVRETLDRNLMM